MDSSKVIVKRVKHTMDKSGNTTLSEPYLVSESEYDSNKQLTKESLYTDDELIQVTELAYTNGLCTKVQIQHIEDGFEEHITSEYNEDKLLVRQVKNYGMGSDITNFKYADGLLITRTTTDEEGNLESNSNYEYENGILKNYEEYSFGDLILKRERDFENGFPVSEKQWANETGKTITLKFTSFAKDLDPSYQVYTEQGDFIERIEKNYNDHGKISSEITESKYNGYQKHLSNYQYDSDGNLIESTIVDANDNIIGKTVNQYESNRIVTSEHFEAVISQGHILHYTDYYVYE
jgi:hypothetical protein